MGAPPIHYVTTSDGFDIAYAVSGEGRPFVFLPQPVSHLQVYWTEDTWVRPWFEGLAERFQLIQYDGRGQGLSTRGLKQDITFDDLEADLETVLQRLQTDSFVLMGVQPFGHVAIRYAVKHPRRVRALVLCSCPVSLGSWPLAVLSSSGQDWNTVLRARAGLSQASNISASVERQKKSLNQEDASILNALYYKSEVAALLAKVGTPTLVLHPRESLNLAPEESMKLAAAIRNASLALIEGATPLGDAGQGLAAIEEFLAGPDSLGELPSSLAGTEQGMLSTREREVLSLLAAGKTNQQIADELVISLNTVRRHVSNIFDKTGVANRAQAAIFARDHSLA